MIPSIFDSWLRHWREEASPRSATHFYKQGWLLMARKARGISGDSWLGATISRKIVSGIKCTLL